MTPSNETFVNQARFTLLAAIQAGVLLGARRLSAELRLLEKEE